MQSALIQRAFPVCYRSQVRKTKGSAAFCDQRMTFDIRSWTAEHSVNSLATVQFQTNCETSKRASLRHGKLHVNSDKCLILIGEKKKHKDDGQGRYLQHQRNVSIRIGRLGRVVVEPRATSPAGKGPDGIWPGEIYFTWRPPVPRRPLWHYRQFNRSLHHIQVNCQ